MDILSGLNDKQREAVTTIDGPVLIIAGAGSGKTKALTHRIAYLISKGIKPDNILAVTFTNKAAGEMRERVVKLINPPKSPESLPASFYKREGTATTPSFEKGGRGRIFKIPTISTFHSFCARVLHNEIDKLGYSRDFVIFDPNDQASLMKKIMEDLNISADRFKPKGLLHAISVAKNELMDADEYEKSQDGFFEEIVAKVYKIYQDELKKVGAVDFDDLIMLTVKIFQEYPKVLEKYQKQYKYILIDEYQDTNQAQYLLVKLLAEKYRNICVVGDDWQCIYAWRQADFRNILNFEKDWPDAKIVMLEENYRSTQNILDASHGVIEKNTDKTDKKLWTKASKGYPIIISEVYNEESEGRFIVNEIEKLIDDDRNGGHPMSTKLKPKDFVVLYRTNAQSRAIEEAFLQAGFPYKIIGTVKFYSRREIKDVLSYLRLIINPKDIISLQRVINVPPRGIGKTSVDKIMNISDFDITDEEMVKNKVILSPQSHKSLLELSKIISKFKKEADKHSILDLIKKLLSSIEYEKYINDGSPEGESRWENVQELITVAKKYKDLKGKEALTKFLEDVTLMSDADQVESKDDLVNLMTLHSVKGLEFPVVFIAGCEEGLLPHSRSWLDQAQMEEERRLCYVGLTRAKSLAYMIYASRRNLYGSTEANSPSRFIDDIPHNLLDFRSELADFDDGEDIEIIDMD